MRGILLFQEVFHQRNRYRRRGELPAYDDTDVWEYVADENTYTLEDNICERMDRENILKDYTHFPDKFMIEQMQNVVFDI